MSTTPDKPRNSRSRAAEAAFRARLAELGATLVNDQWLGHRIPHPVRCAQGHECAPRPNGVQQGQGICSTCAGNDPRAAEAAFRARLAELGATLLDEQWSGVNAPYQVQCAQGHLCTPRPNHVQQGGGICSTCAGNDPRAAEAAFRARLAELGATLLDEQWSGNKTPHRVRCARGHEVTARPNCFQQRRGFCRQCRRPASFAAEAAFRARLEELGATLLEEEWLESHTPHRVRCAQGHEVTPRPNGIQQGQGICRKCAGQVWDVFYVVQDDVNDVIKFGVTSGDPRPRLQDHARNGFEIVLRVHRGLPDGVARALELAILAALRDAGETPVRGMEFFPAHALDVVLDLVDNHPDIRAAP